MQITLRQFALMDDMLCISLPQYNGELAGKFYIEIEQHEAASRGVYIVVDVGGGATNVKWWWDIVSLLAISRDRPRAVLPSCDLSSSSISCINRPFLLWQSSRLS